MGGGSCTLTDLHRCVFVSAAGTPQCSCGHKHRVTYAPLGTLHSMRRHCSAEDAPCKCGTNAFRHHSTCTRRRRDPDHDTLHSCQRTDSTVRSGHRKSSPPRARQTEHTSRVRVKRPILTAERCVYDSTHRQSRTCCVSYVCSFRPCKLSYICSL